MNGELPQDLTELPSIVVANQIAGTVGDLMFKFKLDYQKFCRSIMEPAVKTLVETTRAWSSCALAQGCYDAVNGQLWELNCHNCSRHRSKILPDNDKRIGDWYQTYSGIKFWPYDPRPEEIIIEDIAHHLSLQCRYNGACKIFYSIAEHSVRVSEIVSKKLALWGLLHDATEAYLGDMIRPVKFGMPQYRELELSIMSVIVRKFGLSLPEPKEIKNADEILLYTEKRDLLQHNLKWPKLVVPLPGQIIPWSSEETKQRFLARYEELKQ